MGVVGIGGGRTPDADAFAVFFAFAFVFVACCEFAQLKIAFQQLIAERVIEMDAAKRHFVASVLIRQILAIAGFARLFAIKLGNRNIVFVAQIRRV